MNKIKHLILTLTLVFSSILMAANSKNISWKEKAKINLDTLYNQIKENYSTKYIGRAYGISLDKVKNVKDQKDFNDVIKDFSNILKDPNIVIQSSSNMQYSNSPEIKYTSKLPYGDFLILIKKSKKSY